MKYLLILYMCSTLSGQCPNSVIAGYSFDSHTACVEFGYRAAHNTFKNLKEADPDLFTDEYVENSRLAVKFECKPVSVPKDIVPPPKPKVTT